MRLAWPWLFCAVWATAAPAQDAPPKVEERVAVRLVQLAIRAGARGAPVTDLRADEIVVEERGRAMRVAFLEPFVSRVEAPPSGVRLYVGVPGAGAEAAEPAAGVSRYLIFLVDRENDYRLTKDSAMEQ